jgi:diguanylate cyclase (GGDEF)-like protein
LLNRFRQPTRLALAVIAALVVFQGGFAWAIASIRERTNTQAEADSIRHMTVQLDQLRQSLRGLAIDYNNWSDAYQAVQARDADWIWSNYAYTALDGQLFDGVVFIDGSLPEPWAWSAADPRKEPSPSFLPAELLDRLRAEVRNQTPGAWQTFDMSTVVDGQLVLLSATQVVPTDQEEARGLDPDRLSTAILAYTVGPEGLASLAEDLFVDRVTFQQDTPSEGANIVVTGPDGEALGTLSWTPPAPGNILVKDMAPVLIAMALLNTTLGGAAAWLIRSRANQNLRERLQAEELARQADRLARTDPMTGLPNRLAFSEHLARLEARAVPQVGILFIDLNDFKAVNDAIGHAGGDALVVAVADRLAYYVEDAVFLARLGGDEFVFVVSGEDGVTLKSSVLAKLVVEAIAPPFEVLDVNVHVRLSQGLALRLSPEIPLSELVRRADLAMYRAKQDRLADAQVYTPELDGHLRRDREMEVALRAALERPDEFTIVYQPIFHAHGQSFGHAEALARWTSPILGPVPPNVFISLAERTGLMGSLGRLLLRLICADLARCPGLRVSINLSPVQLRDPSFLSELDACLQRYGIEAKRIEFELTEGVMIDRADRAHDQLARLRRRGFSLALDDFGTGFSSIGYLTSMPFDTLKIDQGFLTGGEDLTKNLALIRSIVHLGHTMGKTVVCEGIETQAQAAALRDTGCNQLQGNFFARPMPLDSLAVTYPERLALVA